MRDDRHPLSAVNRGANARTCAQPPVGATNESDTARPDRPDRPDTNRAPLRRSCSYQAVSDFDPGLRRLAGRIGAYTVHSRHDGREITAAARHAFGERFLKQVDPEGILTPEERMRRADAARKAYFAQLAFRSAVARRAKAARRGQGR